jgi:surface antigen
MNSTVRVLRPFGVFGASLVVASLAIAGVFAPEAVADSRTVTVNTGAGDLSVRSAPSAKSQRIGTVRNQSLVQIVCYTRGEAFSGGPYRLTTSIWNKLDKGGFVTDAMLNTGSNEPVVPRCDGEAPIPAGPARATGRTSQENSASLGSPAWGALEKWFQVSKRQFYPAISGAPRELANAARAAGWTVVERPEPRSIVVFAPGVDGAPPSGHVAWVDTTTERRDGLYVSITEVHGNGDGLNTWTSRQVKDLPGMSYILLP